MDEHITLPRLLFEEREKRLAKLEAKLYAIEDHLAPMTDDHVHRATHYGAERVLIPWFQKAREILKGEK